MIVERQMSDLRQGAQENVASYATRTQALANQLAALGSPMADARVRSSFLRGLVSLPSSRVDLLSFQSPPPSFEATIALARQFEEDDALQRLRSKGGGKGGGAPAGDGAPAYYAGTPPGQRQRGRGPSSSAGGKHKSGVECFYCHKKGHVQQDCRSSSAMRATTNKIARTIMAQAALVRLQGARRARSVSGARSPAMSWPTATEGKAAFREWMLRADPVALLPALWALGKLTTR
jgi:hypothetical protein